VTWPGARAVGVPLSGDNGGVSEIARVSDWLFRDRATGKIVIGQFPNLPLIGWLVATVLAAVTSGQVSMLAGYAATVALVVWAGDELLRGVNPFRRILGAAVLGWVIVSLVRG
jgi:hypothetical protein